MECPDALSTERQEEERECRDQVDAEELDPLQPVGLPVETDVSEDQGGEPQDGELHGLEDQVHGTTGFPASTRISLMTAVPAVAAAMTARALTTLHSAFSRSESCRPLDAVVSAKEACSGISAPKGEIATAGWTPGSTWITM